MIAAALELEAEQYVQALRHLRDNQGHALVVRNGTSHHERTVHLGAGSIKIKTPRVNDRRPDRRFTSRILPPYMRRSPRLDEAIPVLYLRGLSTGDFSEALQALLGHCAGRPVQRQKRPVSRPRRSRACSKRGRTITRPGANVLWEAKSTSTSGPTVSTSTFAWKRTVWPAW